MPRVFKKDAAGVSALLKSQAVKQMTENVARRRAGGAEVKSFVGWDRAKTIIGGKKK